MDYEIRAIQDKLRELERQLDNLSYDVRRLQEGSVSNSRDIQQLKDRVREFELRQEPRGD